MVPAAQLPRLEQQQPFVQERELELVQLELLEQLEQLEFELQFELQLQLQ